MTGQVDTVPNTLTRFTQAATALQIQQATPPPTLTTTAQWTPTDHIGRIPCIGLDSGHIPGTRPDTSAITQSHGNPRNRIQKAM